MTDKPKLIGHTRKSPLHAPDLSVYKTDKVTMIKVSKYNPSNIYLRFDNRMVPQLIELLQQCVEQKKPDVAAIKEQYKNAERDFLKNCQSIHGKKEGLRQYNEIMEREQKLKDFVNKQEPLGEEFEKVLKDNLWDLYDE